MILITPHLRWSLITVAIILAGLFVPYEKETIYVSDVTGSVTTVYRWFLLFETRKTEDSELRQWCRKHNVPVQENDRFLARDTFSVMSRDFADGFWAARFRLPPGYAESESEAGIRAYVAAMMAAPDDETRSNLAAQAAHRAMGPGK
jgi:hypothetical protein